MTVTVHDITRHVTWSENGREHTGILHRVPEPGTASWWRTNGKVTVLERDAAGDTFWVHVHRDDLTVVEQPEEVP